MNFVHLTQVLLSFTKPKVTKDPPKRWNRWGPINPKEHMMDTCIARTIAKKSPEVDQVQCLRQAPRHQDQAISLLGYQCDRQEAPCTRAHTHGTIPLLNYPVYSLLPLLPMNVLKFLQVMQLCLHTFKITTVLVRGKKKKKRITHTDTSKLQKTCTVQQIQSRTLNYFTVLNISNTMLISNTEYFINPQTTARKIISLREYATVRYAYRGTVRFSTTF